MGTRQFWLLFARTIVAPGLIIVSGWFFIGDFLAAILAPAVLCWSLLRPLNAIRNPWVAAALAVATVAGTTLVALGIFLLFGKVGPFWPIFLTGWFTWLLTPTLTGMAAQRFCRRIQSVSVQAGVACCFLALAYVLQGLFVFDWSKPIGNGDPEIYDAAGRLGVVYPASGIQSPFVCVPYGPHFLWSVDYSGNEWIYAIFRPHIKVWFGLYRNNYFELGSLD